MYVKVPRLNSDQGLDDIQPIAKLFKSLFLKEAEAAGNVDSAIAGVHKFLIEMDCNHLN